MQSQVHYLVNPNQTQVIFSKILTKVITLYQRFVPNEVRNRRNIYLQKQPSVVMITSYLWAVQEGYRTASAIYRAIQSLPKQFPRTLSLLPYFPKSCSKHSADALFYGLRLVSNLLFRFD